MAGKENKQEKEKPKDEVITAIYRVNLHCPQCGSKIKKSLLVTPGVQSVETDIEKGEIKAKGKIDPIKIQKIIERKSKKKVELVSPKVKVQESSGSSEIKVKQIKEPVTRTTSLKVHMHCDKCEHDLRNRLLKHKGIFEVKTDMKAQTITIEGTIEPEKLLSYMRKRVHKHAEIIATKANEKKEEKKDKGKDEGKSSEPTKEKAGESKPSSEPNKAKEETKGESKTKENVPYFIHYVYAPQLFSDENPNACSIF